MKEGNSPKRTNYWPTTMDGAIDVYNCMEPGEARDDYYLANIDEPLQHLAESLVNGLKVSDYILIEEDRDDIIKEVKSFMLTKTPHYKSVKGKSYSFFTVVGKHYLIAINKKAYTRRCNTLSISQVDTHDDFEDHDMTMAVPPDEKQELENRINEMVRYWEEHGHLYFRTEIKQKSFKVWLDYMNSPDRGDHGVRGYFSKIKKTQGAGCTNTVRSVLNTIKYVNSYLLNHYNTHGDLHGAPVISSSYYKNKN